MNLPRIICSGMLSLVIAGCASAHGTNCVAGGPPNNCQPASAPAPEAVRRAPRLASPAIVVPPVIRPQPVPAPPTATTLPAAPAVKGICSPGGCTGTDAQTYQGGTGTTYMNNGGRPCHRNGVWMQCF
ncbi:hypothetical protein [Noviherbaspirillum sp.]|uniref:hypothetical protein n=1 Tax=Noviherbaspirillum sp. TaxID=1926288 RepID=UPI002FE10647